MANLALSSIEKSFGTVKVIKGVDLEIPHGEFVVFVGPSGCGKSTLLRLVAGLENPTDGDIIIDGEDVTDEEPYDRGIAMVFQSYALYPHMTVAENMGFALRLQKQPKKERRAAVERAAEILQITQLLDRKPAQLSGGQRQRVAIGRAIVRDPKVFLFDEPLSNLDAELRVQTRMEIARLHKKLGATMIYVTHDQTEAMTMADRIVVLRDGIVEQVGSPTDLYDDPDNMFVAGFIGSPKMNFVPCVATGDNQVVFGNVPIQLPALNSSLVKGAEYTIGIRPEHLQSDAGQAVSMNIEAVEQLGSTAFVHGDLVSEQSTCRLVVEMRDQRPTAGDNVQLHFDPKRLVLFNEAGQRVR
ncbi:ABC transporter ATP-binding protein [Halocynthiibacter sp. C4]|uniref:ABC transporter ATP-binding protein n=1 Tax=Halocynthiibacter sp. C4 TaxID=2992758 RepID=UPI00237C4BD7|nr:ABC transporter ATP-binding protein [Halocynthiibacter sp. C4]MDE0588859.1 ABC transporter ATP-binding protein [Halocynthiibacter sp. C4]